MKKLRNILLIVTIFFGIALLATHPVLAQGNAQIVCPDGSDGIDTAIGCIPLNNSGGASSSTLLTGFVLKWGIGIASGIALLLIGYSGIQLSSAGGDPQKVENAKALFNAAITGLLFMVFSTVALRFVGVDILGITGLAN